MEAVVEVEGSNYGMMFYTPMDVAVGFFQKLLNKYYKENYVRVIISDLQPFIKHFKNYKSM